jgi:predicted nucleotidyltransferase
MIADDNLREIAGLLADVPGIRAVVLGGSRARGTHHSDSDVDLGLYYDVGALDVHILRSAAAGVQGTAVDVAGPGGWGPWVDGGAWLRVDGTAVDLILRDVDRVRAQRDRAVRGEHAFHVQLGHPLGFLDVAYAAEVATCRPLAGDTALVEELRSGLDPYPRALRDSLIARLEDAEFLLGGAAKAVPRGDVAYLQLCSATALLWCAHAWHAEAGAWVTNEKGLVPDVARLPLDTNGFVERAMSALGGLGPGTSPDALAPTLEAVRGLVSATRARLS